MKSHTRSSPESDSIRSAKLAVVMLLVAVPAAVYMLPGSPWPVAAAFGLYILLAVAFDSGLIACTLFGVMLGHFLDPGIKGGTIESQTRETIAYLFLGTLVGVLVGFAIDGFRESYRSPTRLDEGRRERTQAKHRL